MQSGDINTSQKMTAKGWQNTSTLKCMSYNGYLTSRMVMVMSDFAKDFDEDETLADMAQFIQAAGYIHQSDLRELIEQWRYRIKGIDDFQGRCPEINEIETCINELEELIE